MAGGGVSIDLGHTLQMLFVSYAHFSLHLERLGVAKDVLIRIMVEQKSELVPSDCHNIQVTKKGFSMLNLISIAD